MGKKSIKWNNVIKLVLVIFLIYIVAFQYQNLIELFAGINQESSEIVAREFVIMSPTYSFDGKKLELTNARELECENCWEFTYTFKSTNDGYGDRSSEDLEEDMVVGHRIRVVVNNKRIESAVIDDYWDAIEQKPIE